MIFLTKERILQIHERIIARTGGSEGWRDEGALESALAQPMMTFGGRDLYPTFIEKAAALGFSLISNHPFVDGNKRIGHAAMALFLDLNGYEIDASDNEQEQIILGVAASQIDRKVFVDWLKKCVRSRN